MEFSGRYQAPAALLPEKKSPILTEQEAGRAPEPVTTFRITEESLAPAGTVGEWRLDCIYS
jgi:hypothetical protein